MVIFCIRHPESIFNAEGRIQGQHDVPLSPLGLLQRDALAAALARQEIDAIYSSPLDRALDAANAAAEATGLKVQLDDRLMELNAGVFQTLSWSELAAKYPEEARRWRAQDPDFVIPGGESRRQLMTRAGQFFHAMREREHRRAAVVSHGGLLNAAFKHLLQVPAELNPFRFRNASISQLEWHEQVRLASLNQIDHLTGVVDPATTRTGDL